MIYLPLPTTKEQCTSFVNAYKHNLQTHIQNNSVLLTKFIDFILERAIGHYGVTEKFMWISTKEQLSGMTPYRPFSTPQIF